MLRFEAWSEIEEINNLQPFIHTHDRFPGEGPERRCEASVQEVISGLVLETDLSRST
jgi:hypothetical protein